MNLAPKTTDYTGRKTPAHCLEFPFIENKGETGSLDIYYSYETPVAFQGMGVIARTVNYWGPTTGRHLNETGIYKERELESLKFEKALSKALKSYYKLAAKVKV
jgi:hypothetical protein